MRIAAPSPWQPCTSYSLPVLTDAPKFKLAALALMALDADRPAAAITADASGRLIARPPWFIGLSRKSPTVAPNGRVRMKAAQNNSTRDMFVQT
jgi:hypothetical protein